MSAHIENGKLMLEISDLLESLSGDALEDLINRLSVNEAVFSRIATQIVHGLTDDGWCASTTSMESEYPTPLMVARRFVAQSASEVAAAEIARMQAAIDRQREENSSLRTELNSLKYPHHGQFA